MSANFLCCSCSAPSNLIFELVNSQTDELFKTLEREREKVSEVARVCLFGWTLMRQSVAKHIICIFFFRIQKCLEIKFSSDWTTTYLPACLLPTSFQVESILKVKQIYFVEQELWSSGYVRRLMVWSSRIRIPAPYTGWTSFTYIWCKKINVSKDENKRKRGRVCRRLKMAAATLSLYPDGWIALITH